MLPSVRRDVNVLIEAGGFYSRKYGISKGATAQVSGHRALAVVRCVVDVRWCWRLSL